ncbi:putative transcriptional regulator [Magnetofaba australis IT-1]|uniref:Putative transcriptional regulator n=2 Tax=Magnetofaba TaxID=1472292 RepID=A0A1Y2K0L0_9PROT|nr:putative transcriptional regulator [Magnetofaba australis IT-1]
MDLSMSQPTETRAEQRRKQVLDAAAECFLKYGFRGASIARISKVAGMSPGHIYHFFPNKEAIIAGIVARRLEIGLELVAGFEAAEQPFEAMVRDVDTIMARKTESEYSGMWLEILAESARNPKIAAIIQEADRAMRERITKLEALARQRRGVESSLPTEAVTEVAMALFEGMSNRIVLNPEMDRKQAEAVLRHALEAILLA